MSRIEHNRTPDLAEVLQAIIDQKLSETHTMLPGRVEKYNTQEQKADIKPLLKHSIVLQNGTEIEPESLPVIPNVPVLFPRGAGFFVSMPINKGDFVMLLFCEKSLDRFMHGAGNETDPVLLHNHSLSDAVALPGLYPFSKKIKDISDQEMVIGQDKGGMQIHITNDGSIDITYASGLTLHVENKGSDAKLVVGDGAVSAMIAEQYQTFWTNVKAIFDVHAHAGGGSAPPPVPFPAYNTAITSTKVKFPNG